MDNKEESAFIKDIFTRTKLNEQAKYRKGQGIRQMIFDKLAQGENVENYRIDFLRNSVNKLFHFMEELGMDFNKKHPDDCWTAADLGDVLVTAINCLNKLEDGN